MIIVSTLLEGTLFELPLFFMRNFKIVLLLSFKIEFSSISNPMSIF
jgi:hypothetical protein